MAMLAEPRRKIKYSTDPRGLNWSKDDSKFGQKLMEKMGWSQGKGLGANEDGKVDHVAVRIKTDARGVGCTKNNADNWIAHQDDFNSILAGLNADHKNDSDSNQGNSNHDNDEVTSLEQRSKNAKGKIHYHKFAKGKDLSSCKKEDFDAIFGRRKNKSNPSTPQNLSQANSAGNSESDSDSSGASDEKKTTEEHTYGITTITHTTSVADYFAQKMAALNAKRNGVSDSHGQTETPAMTCEESSGSVASKKKKSKKKKKERVVNVNDSEQTKCEDVKKENKSKKKKKDLDSDSVCNSVNTEVEESSSTKKKSKKKKDKVPESAQNSESVDAEIMESASSKKKKSKKKKKEKELDAQPEEVLQETTKREKKKKKKDRKQTETVPEKVDEEPPKKEKKKKHKKRKREEDADAEDEEKTENPPEKKAKKQKALLRRKDTTSGDIVTIDPNKVDEAFTDLGSNLGDIKGYANFE